MRTKLLTMLKRTVLTAVVTCLGLVMAPKAMAGVPYPSDLYLTQQSDVTCTLVSNAMMLRARMYLSNNSNWSAITESSLAPYCWINGAGQVSTYSCSFGGGTLNVNQAYVNGLTVSQLQGILDAHPEGVCIYVTSIPHAQWITDIEDGIVYSGDSSCPAYFGRRPLANTLQGQCCGYNQYTVLSCVTSYWYVSSHSIPSNTSYTTTTVTQGSPSLPDGDYRIACYSDAKYGVDVAGASTDDEANVHVWEYTDGAKQQQFNVTFSGDHYNVRALHSGKNIDLYRAGSAAGTNVMQYTPDGTSVQNWVLREAGSGAYYMVNNNGLHLDVADGIVANGTNIQGWTGNESNAQKWVFIAVNGQQSLPDGDYQLRSAQDFGFAADVKDKSTKSGATVQLWSATDSDNQKWALKYVGNGYYTLTAKHSGMALNVYGGYYKDGPDVQQYPYTDGDAASMWMLKDAGNGSFYIVNKNGSFLDADRAVMANGTNIGGWCGNSGDNQKWKIVAVNGTQTIEDGCYNIRCASDPTFGIDVEAVSRDNGANVHLWTIGEGNNQKWRVKYLGDGYYSIVAAHSGKALDVYNKGIDNSANVQQYDNSASVNSAQQWILRDAGDGSFYIINRNGLFLDAFGGTMANGTNVQGFAGNGTAAQKWVLTEAEIDSEAPVISDIKVTDVSQSGYTVTCTVSDNVGVTSVAMPTWTEEKGQDDIIWHEATVTGNTATCTIKTSDHNNESGVYITHIYAYDEVQNVVSVEAPKVDVPATNVNPNRLPGGTYRIACYSNPKFGIDVEAISTADEANVHVWEYVGGKNQHFNVTFDTDHYNFQAVHSGKNIDLYKAGSAAGTNVMQYTPDGTAVQNWTLRDAGDGAYYIVNSNGLYLDAANGTIANGTNVQGWTGNESDAQKWLFIAVDGTRTLPDGDYQICLAKSVKYGIEVQDSSDVKGGNVALNTLGDADNQKWSVRYLGDGYYSIRSKHSSMALNLSGGFYTGNPNVQQWDFIEGDAASMWILKSAGDGNFYVVNKNGRFLDIANGTFANGVNMQGCSGNSSDAQTFRFVAVDGSQTMADGTYEIRNSSNRDFGLDVEHVSKEDNANIHLWTMLGAENQRWKLKYLGNGYYSIVSVLSGKALELENGGVTNGTNVQQFTENAAENAAQQWMLRSAGQDVFYIINKKGLFLDAFGGTMADGTNVQGYEGNGTIAQKWVIVPAVDNDEEAPEITDIAVTEVSQAGYRVTCKVKDNVGVKSVKMPTWTVADGQDDIVWHDATISGNKASFFIRSTEHKKEIGYYITHIYAYDYAGNATNSSAGQVDVPVTKGVFRIACSADNAFGLDVAERSTDNGANVHLWTYGDGNNQKFQITRRDDGYYTIEAAHSGKALDLTDGKAANGTNVQTWEWNNNNINGLWKLVHNEDGTYTFLSKVNEEYALDAFNADAADGVNIQVWKSNNTSAQKWNILPAEVTVSGGSGYDGYQGGRGGSGNIMAYGVDVSEHQGVGFNFQAIKNAGYSFVILRCGFVSRKDYRFEEYYAAAKAAGLNVGAYFYSYAENASEASYEADQCLSYIAGKTFEYPIYFDFEDAIARNCDARSVCLTFLDKVAAQGYLVGLYGYASWLDEDYNGWVPTAQICQKYECWIANYPYANYVDNYTQTYKTRYGMFQFTDGDTSQGLAAGAGIDTNICFKDYPSIVKQYGFNGYAATSNRVQKIEDDYEPTRVLDISNSADKSIERVEYVNVSGQVSNKPFKGFNVVVTIYTDGSKDVQKKVVR